MLKSPPLVATLSDSMRMSPCSWGDIFTWPLRGDRIIGLRHPLYSSSRLVTLCLSPISFPTGDEFQWGEVGERLVRAHAVVGVFPMAQLMIELQWLIRVRVHLIELFMVGSVRALDMGIEFR